MNSLDQLNDLEIRKAFIERVLASSQKPKAIIEELRVHNGNAIADVVAVYKEMHCYEIKGDADKIERAVQQARYYDLAFRKITLITTSRHVDKASKLLPEHWGLIKVRKVKGRLVFSSARAARVNRSFDKRTALLTLWRSELINIAEGFELSKLDKQNREDLSCMISQRLGRSEINEYISAQLISRNQKMLSM